MSQSKMLIPANLPGVQIPEGYMLVTQAKPAPNRASNSAPSTPTGRTGIGIRGRGNGGKSSWPAEPGNLPGTQVLPRLLTQ